MKPVRTIGIVNGGGDAPGRNAVIHAVVRTAISRHNMQVIGIRNGFDGLIWPEGAKEMTEDSVSGILPRGGTILGTTNRGNPFAYKTTENGGETVHDYSSLCMDNARRLGIDAIIVIGGDGTQHIARDFSSKGMSVVGVPKTIDNDLDATEVTLGFDIAPVIATEAVDRLHTTAESHHRVMLIEVMGRDAGWIALHAGIILGTRLGVAATDLVAKHHFGRMVCLKSGKIESVSPDEALEKMKYVDPDSEIVHGARSVGATFGDAA